jgi:hypothetical protein
MFGPLPGPDRRRWGGAYGARVSATRHDVPVKRALWLFLPIVVMGLIGPGSSSSAGTTTPHSDPTCTAMKRAVQAGQKLPSIVAGTSLQTSTKTKRELLATVNKILNAFAPLKVQLRTAPADVRTAFNSVASVAARFRTAVRNATTPTQIKRAERILNSNYEKTFPFFAYVISRCEGSTPDP